jgi:hypothetical protein
LPARSQETSLAIASGDCVTNRPQTQGQWYGPQLTDGQRLDALEWLEEAPEGLGLDPAVGVGDEGGQTWT